jgi:hypothetical protein
MEMAERRPVTAEELLKIENSDFELDELGDFAAPEGALRAMMTSEREILLSGWPGADYELIDSLASDIAEFRMHTLRTGEISYVEAQSLGSRIIGELGTPNK